MELNTTLMQSSVPPDSNVPSDHHFPSLAGTDVICNKNVKEQPLHYLTVAAPGFPNYFCEYCSPNHANFPIVDAEILTSRWRTEYTYLQRLIDIRIRGGCRLRLPVCRKDATRKHRFNGAHCRGDGGLSGTSRCLHELDDME